MEELGISDLTAKKPAPSVRDQPRRLRGPDDKCILDSLEPFGGILLSETIMVTGSVSSASEQSCKDPTGELKDWSDGCSVATLTIIEDNGDYLFIVEDLVEVVGCSFTLKVRSGASSGPDTVTEWDCVIVFSSALGDNKL